MDRPGAIWLHRKALDSAVFQDDWLWRLWSWCMMMANWKTGHTRDGIEIPPGSFMTSGDRAAEALSVDRSKLRRGLAKLQKLGNIVVNSTNSYTIITICNWESYQNGDLNDRPTPDQRPTDGQPTPDQRPTTIEQGNNGTTSQQNERPSGKRTAHVYHPTFLPFWEGWPEHRREKKKRAFEAWKRAARRVMTEKGFEDKQEAIKFLYDEMVAYRETEKGKGRFCVQPATWLNGSCWDDSALSQTRGDDGEVARPKQEKLPTFEELRDRCKFSLIRDGRTEARDWPDSRFEAYFKRKGIKYRGGPEPQER
jgi:hypothetical protein